MRFFIVDDEEMACRGLHSMISRILGPGEHELYTYQSPLEALEQALQLRPEVIFLDIIMPELSGIEFIERIHQSYFPEIVIISGNDDYQYVRQCFKQNVRDYLLKPIEFDELKTILLKLQNGDGFPDEHPADDGLPFLFSAAVKGREAEARFRGAVIAFPERTGLNGRAEASVKRGDFDDIIFTFRLSAEGDYTALRNGFVSLFREISSSYGGIYKAAVSGLYPVSSSGQSQQELFALLKLRFYSEGSACYTPENRVEAGEGESPEFFRQLSALPAFLSVDDTTVYRDFIARWFVPARMQRQSYDSLRRQYEGAIDRLLYNVKPDVELEIRDFRAFNTIEEIVFEVNRLLDGIVEYLFERKQNDKGIIELVFKYVEENYQKDISLASVSNYYNFNYSYFSRIFREYVGISFSQYLLKFRMEKAREILITNSELKVNDVAVMVGYSSDNPQNFTRAFKKYFGKSPKNYKL